MKVAKLFLNAIVAWILGIASIAAILYFSNDVFGLGFTMIQDKAS